MKIDLTTFSHKKGASFQTKSLGKLYVFSLTIGGYQKLHNELGKTIEECQPSEVVKTLIKYVCHPEDNLVEGQHKPKEPSLDDQAVEELDDSELDSFASLYIQQNEHLFRESIENRQKDKDGKTTVSFELGDIEYPQKANESNIAYLQRLLAIDEQKMLDSVKKALKPLFEITNFSKGLQNKIRSTLSLGDALKNSTARIASLERVRPVAIEPLEHSIDLAELAQDKVRPFRELADKLDVIIDTSMKTADFMVEMNKTQIEIAQELKESGGKAARFSKTNIILGIIIIVLTVGSMIMGFYSIHHSNQATKRQNDIVSAGIEMFDYQLSSLNKSTESIIENNTRGFDLLLKKYSEAKDSTDSLVSNILKQQNPLIEEINKAREQDARRIELLEAKLKELSEKLRQANSGNLPNPSTQR